MTTTDVTFDEMFAPEEEAESPNDQKVLYLRGDNLNAVNCRDPEILIEGPSRTGKTFAILFKMHSLAMAYPGFRGLIARKVAATLGNTALQTLEDDVFQGWDRTNRASTLEAVNWYGGSERAAAAYIYNNGSSITVGGMDSQTKILGAEYDFIFCNQAEELTEDDLELLLTRLSHGLIAHMRMVCDCNPSYDRHWLLKRCNSGRMTRFRSTLKDNPKFYDDQGEPTPTGVAYLQQLEGLTGSRRQRFLLGEWVGMENAIYAEAMRPAVHLVEIPEHTHWTGRGFSGVDYGETPSHPSTVTTIMEATTGVWWVRISWAATGGNTEEINEQVRAHKVRFGITSHRVITDPTIRAYADNMGWDAADGSAGSRKVRVGQIIKMLDSDSLKFDKYGEGIEELWNEMNMYRWETVESAREIKQVVVRKDEDRVAGLEYAGEGASGPGLKPLDLNVPKMEKRTIGGRA